MFIKYLKKKNLSNCISLPRAFSFLSKLLLLNSSSSNFLLSLLISALCSSWQWQIRQLFAKYNERRAGRWTENTYFHKLARYASCKKSLCSRSVIIYLPWRILTRNSLDSRIQKFFIDHLRDDLSVYRRSYSQKIRRQSNKDILIKLLTEYDQYIFSSLVFLQPVHCRFMHLNSKYKQNDHFSTT